jgi:hypothetical protein
MVPPFRWAEFRPGRLAAPVQGRAPGPVRQQGPAPRALEWLAEFRHDLLGHPVETLEVLGE